MCPHPPTKTKTARDSNKNLEAPAPPTELTKPLATELTKPLATELTTPLATEQTKPLATELTKPRLLQARALCVRATPL